MSCSRSNRTRTRIKNDEEDINTINSTEITNNSPIEMENKQTNTNTTTNNLTKMSNYGLLNWEQVQRLDELLNKPIPIHGRYSSFSANSGVNYSSSSTASTPSPSPSPQQQQYSSSSAAALPTLNVKLKDFIRELNKRLISRRVNIKEIRINGGVASYVLAKDHSYQFSDIDIIFSTDLLQMNDEQNDTNDSSYTTTTASISPEACFNMCCDQIRDTVFDCLIDHMPADIERPTRSQIRESYVKKMVKIYESNPSGAINNSNNSNGDNECESFESQKSLSRWSLISLHNIEGQNIELKFVDKMKRQFQFSVDAFQIHIDTLLKYYDCQDSMNNESSIMNANLYPSVRAESMYGEFSEALAHLNEKLIATKSPEQIRGGGLLKYCNLLIRGYKPVCDLASMHALEKYMCSRFFIDFSDLKEQEHKLVAYLDSHFQNDSMMCQAYLTRLYHVVNASTVCLMGHERKQTLNLIESLAQRFSSSNCLQQQQQANVQSSATGGLSTNSSSSSLLLASASASSLMSSSSSNLNAGTDNMMINRVEFGLDEIVSSSSSNNEHVNNITISNNRVINNNSDGQQNSLSTSATTTTTTTTTSGSTSSSDIEMSENEFVIRHNHHNYNHNNSHNQRANQSTAAVYFYHSQNQYHPNYNQQQYQQQFQQPNYQQPINKQHHKNKNRQYSNNNNNQNYFHTNNNANSNNTNNNYNQNQQNRNNFNSAYNSNKYWQQHPAQMGRAPNLNNNRKSFNPNNNYYYNQQQQQQQYQAYHTFDSNNNKQPNHPYYLYYGYYPPTPGVAGNGEYQQYLMTSMTGANSSSATSPAGSSVSTASSSGGSSGLILSPSPSPSPSVASSSYETTSSLTLVVAASTSSSSQIKESSDEVKVGSRSSSSSSSSSSSEAPSPSPSPPPPMPATEATSETASSASDAPLNRVFYCKLLPNTNSYIEVFDNCFCPPIIVDDEDRTNSATTTSNSSSIITTAARIVTTMNTNTNTDAAVTS